MYHLELEGIWVRATKIPPKALWQKQTKDGNFRMFPTRESVRKSKLNTVYTHRSLQQKGYHILIDLVFPRGPAVYGCQASRFSTITTERTVLVQTAV